MIRKDAAARAVPARRRPRVPVFAAARGAPTGGDMIFMRFFPNEKINEKLKAVCKKHKIETAVVISGIGQLKNVELGYFKEKGNYSSEYFQGPFELLSLNGNICKQGGEYLLHLHTVLGTGKKKTIGGHLISGIVEVTNEIVLLKTNIKLKRKLDNKTGLKTLFFE
ncbi:MAG: DNA-binding protein [Thermoplasmatales archaeon]|nr:MAG: DNA-binding protein [Thermoplasmatales archaeon]